MSVKWASCDLGADDPLSKGLYLSWGSLIQKQNGELSVYEHYKDNAYVDIGSNISGTGYDAVKKYWGGKWRMPTKEEAEELMTACTYSVDGGDVKINAPNGEKITLRWSVYGYTGDMLYDMKYWYTRWTGSLAENDSDAYTWAIEDDYIGRTRSWGRKNETVIRPVCDY